MAVTLVPVGVGYDGERTLVRGIEDGWIEPPRWPGLVPFERVAPARETLEVLEDDRG